MNSLQQWNPASRRRRRRRHPGRNVPGRRRRIDDSRPVDFSVCLPFFWRRRRLNHHSCDSWLANHYDDHENSDFEEDEQQDVVSTHDRQGAGSSLTASEVQPEGSRLSNRDSAPLSSNGNHDNNNNASSEDQLTGASDSSAAESISFIRSHHENYNPDEHSGVSSDWDSADGDDASFAVDDNPTNNNNIFWDHPDDDSYSADSYGGSSGSSTRSGVHPLVEQAIRDGQARRYSRNTYCLAGDFTLSQADMVAICNFLLDLPNAVTRLVFLQTQFSVAAMKVWTEQYLQRPDCRLERLMLSGVMLLPQQAQQQSHNNHHSIDNNANNNNHPPWEILNLFLQALAANTSLVELIIHDTHELNVIDAQVGQTLARALAHSPQLQSLTLRGMGGFSPAGLEHLSHSSCLLDHCCGSNHDPFSSPLQHLTELCLRDCQLDCSKIAVLFRGILGEHEPEQQQQQDEEDHDANHNLDQKLPAKPMKNSLTTLSSLQSLDLSNNNLRAPSLQWLAKFLLLQQQQQQHQEQPSPNAAICLPWMDESSPGQPLSSRNKPIAGLQSLSLTGNRNLFDNATAETQQLANALAVNVSLRRLVMERCGLNGHTASLLFQALETNQTLQELNIRINSGIGAATTVQVVAAAEPASRDPPAAVNNILNPGSNSNAPISKITSYYSHMIQSLPRLAGLKSLAFDALFPQLDRSVLLKALEQNTTLTTLVAHYGLDHAVQNQVNSILRRNQLYQKMQPLLMGTLATENSTAARKQPNQDIVSVVPRESNERQEETNAQEDFKQLTAHPELEYSRGLIAPCLSQWVAEMKHPRSEEHEQVGTTVLFNTLRKYQPWG